MEITTKSAKETKEFGEKIAADLIGNRGQGIGVRKNGAVVLALMGNLGSGKTTFVKGLAKGLGVSQRILSPTFILMRRYEIKLQDFYHVDLYRLEDNIEKEMKNLGIDELWSNNKNVIAIEWAEKAKDFIPKNAIWITFENKDREKRKITI